MIKKTIALSIVVALCETAIYQWALSMSAEDTLYYQLAARYSARLSLLLLLAILCGTGIRGLKLIYSQESHRQVFVSLLFLLAFNHLIHFYFLAMNFESKGLELREFGNLPGSVAYIVLTLSPYFLWNKKELTAARYQIIIAGFSLVIVLFIGTYIKRLFIAPEPPISNFLLIGNLVVLLSLLALNAFRIRVENRAVIN